MRPAHTLELLTFAILIATVQSAVAAGDVGQPECVAPDKFIPTFAVKYGGTTGWPPQEEAARFDLLDVSASAGHSRVFVSEYGNTWETLKRLHPHLLVFLYQNGPCMYNTAAWGKLGEGWQWITAEHGIGSADRWTALGAKHGGYLQHKPYPNERLMVVGNRNWLNFWLSETYANFWTGPGAFATGADGVFADNSGYDLSGGWYLEGQPESDDQPVDYVSEGQYRPELYRNDMEKFYDLAVPWLRARGVKLAANFGNMARAPQAWKELDEEPNPPFAAMEEGAFVHPWGTLGREGNFVFWPEKEWLNQVRTMDKLKRVRALMNVHGPVLSDATDLRRMEASLDSHGGEFA